MFLAVGDHEFHWGNQDDQFEVIECEAQVAAAEIEGAIDLDDVRKATDADEELKLLSSAVQSGFDKTQHLTHPTIRRYYNVRDEIWIQDGILMFKNRIIIPLSLRKKVLSALHSAHQGIDGMPELRHPFIGLG